MFILNLTILLLNDRKVAKNKICFCKFSMILKTTNIKTTVTFYRKNMLGNKTNSLAVILATSEFFNKFFETSK